ncbi:MAG: hypothetical protein M3310_00020 [Actinomycetota bacterium]|nr:hypothetical protein [Actinomycetota bacterium]
MPAERSERRDEVFDPDASALLAKKSHEQIEDHRTRDLRPDQGLLLLALAQLPQDRLVPGTGLWVFRSHLVILAQATRG